MRRLFLLTLLTLNLLTGNVLASVNATQAQLSSVDQAINQTKESINARKSRLENVQSELKHTETVMSEWYSRLAKTKQSLQAANTTITELQTQLNQLNKQRDQQHRALAEQTKAQYMLGEKHPLKILLNNENHANIDRLNKYTEILAQRRLQIISSLQKNQLLLTEKKANLEQQQAELAHLQQQQQVAHQKLQDQLQQRQKLISSIDQSIAQQEINLHNLVENKKRLQALLQRLQQSNNYAGEYVSKHHGHLAWPVNGKIITQFGQPIKDSQLKTTGIVIGAKSGNTVRAVAPGKVVFADWMPGLGFMMIIDHGQSYMSLYGHNQRLLLTVGDIVKTGDEISTVGNTGGQSEPGLYFGIRFKGKPINPQEWLL